MATRIDLPAQMLIEARVAEHALADPASEVRARLDGELGSFVLAGRRVAVAAGSRGIDRLPVVVRAVVAWLGARGARPFVVPAMGSHGGGTAEGQAELLESLGVTEASVGAPIRPSMDTIEIGPTPSGFSAFTSREAAEADAVVLVNRVKAHTDFDSAQLGSGLLKMTAIGLGKAKGAFACHKAASVLGYERAVLEAARLAASRLPPLFGVALVEDGRHRLARVAVAAGPRFEAIEPELLRDARAWMPGLPFKAIDLLIVDEIGKNVSGAGMDPNVIGRGVDGRPFRDGPRPRAIYARSLTPESHGNAVGIGLADVVSSRLVAAMDRQVSYTNSLSAMTPGMVRIPMHFDTDGECLAAALRVAGAEPDRARIVRVRNTLALDRLVVSEAYAEEAAGRDDLTVLTPPRPWPLTPDGLFDPAGDLLAGAGAA